MTLPEGTQVEVVPVQAPRPGSPAALLEVWGSDGPDAIWDTVEKAIEALDSTDGAHEARAPCLKAFCLIYLTQPRAAR